MARSETRATLASGSFMGVISVLMQLRKARAWLCVRVRVCARGCVCVFDWLVGWLVGCVLMAVLD